MLHAGVILKHSTMEIEKLHSSNKGYIHSCVPKGFAEAKRSFGLPDF